MLNLEKDIQEFLEKPSTKEFLNAAKYFILLLETEMPLEEFYPKVHSGLIELYAAGNKLEEIELNYSSDETDFTIEYDNKNKGLISKLGLDCYYWEVYDPVIAEDNKEEITQGWLVDDFADIYRDLKIELLKINTIETNEAIEDALWELRFSFIHHWGIHCINAMRHLHYLHYPGKKI